MIKEKNNQWRGVVRLRLIIFQKRIRPPKSVLFFLYHSFHAAKIFDLLMIDKYIEAPLKLVPNEYSLCYSSYKQSLHL